MPQIVRRARCAPLIVLALSCLPGHAQLLPLGLPEVPTLPVTPNSVNLAANPEVGALLLLQDLAPQTEAKVRSLAVGFGSTQLRDAPFVGPSSFGPPEVASRGLDEKLIVWTELASETSTAVFAHRLTNTGLPIGSKLEIAPAELASPNFGVASCNEGGRCVIAWRQSAFRVSARLVDAAGDLGPSFVVGEVDGGGLSLIVDLAVAVAPDGRFVVLWVEQTGGPGYPGFVGRPRARFFDSDGTPVGLPVELDEGASGVTLATTATGVWDDQGRLLALFDRKEIPATAVFGELFARSFTAAGQPSSAAERIDASGARPALTWCGRERGFLAAWTSLPVPDSIFEQRMLVQEFATGGLPSGQALEVDHTDGRNGALFSPALGCDGAGNAWMAWVESSDVQPSGEIRTLILRPGPPTCRVPFVENPPWAVSCAAFGAEGRFVAYGSFRGAHGESREAGALTLTRDAASFFFQNPANQELYVKTVDGSTLNDAHWLFYGALSNQEFQLNVFDRATGLSRTYLNPQGELASVGDTSAFPEDPEGIGAAAFVGEVEEGEPLPPFLGAGGCAAEPNTLCLAEQFTVELDWVDFQGNAFDGQAIQQTALSGYFAFFDPANVELAVKILDGRAVNGKFWVFYAALTNVQFTLTIRDGAGAVVKQYRNPRGSFGSVADTMAF